MINNLSRLPISKFRYYGRSFSAAAIYRYTACEHCHGRGGNVVEQDKYSDARIIPCEHCNQRGTPPIPHTEVTKR